MLTAHQLYKKYNIQPILENVSFSVNAGERVGLIGPNGCGKSTLLRILAGIEPADQGYVTRTPSDLRAGYLAQGYEYEPGLTLGDLIQKASGDMDRLENELAQLANQLAKTPNQPDLQEAYDQALGRLEFSGGQSHVQLHSILASLELDSLPESQPAHILSGGQKTRLAMAQVLLGNPQMLILDEPTNHLDIGMLEWLENWLHNFPGGALIVSHDRTFLDRTVNRILDLNPITHTVTAYVGNYTDYLEQYLNQVEKHWSAYKDQEAEIRRMRQDIARTKEQSRWVEITTTSRQPTVRRYAKKVAKKALSREKKLNRYLESDDRVEKPNNSWQMKLAFEPIVAGKQVLHMEALSVGYNQAEPLLENINFSIRGGERIVLTGPNGCGKTTLLRTLTGQVQPLAGEFQFGSTVHLGYMTQEQEFLDPERNALQIIQTLAPMNETDTRSFLHFFLFSGDDALRPASQLSYGERARLALARLVVQGCNFLLLDEPINHLDIPSRERFEQALASFEGTILAVVHDRYFIERFATQLWFAEDQHLYREVLVSEIDL
jgi:ATP-binding cassette subfamily F protein 3